VTVRAEWVVAFLEAKEIPRAANVFSLFVTRPCDGTIYLWKFLRKLFKRDKLAIFFLLSFPKPFLFLPEI
jgi:hypothetical protein